MFTLFDRYYYRQVLSHIHDPATWRAFSLTCIYFSELSRAETAARKLEFRVTLSEWLGCTPPYIHDYTPIQFDVPLVLPSGVLHGTVKTNCDIRELNTGYVTHINSQKISVGSSKYLKMYFVKNVFVQEQNRTPQGTIIWFQNLNNKNWITGSECSICHKIHSFQISGSRLMYSKTCLESKYEISVDTFESMLKRAKRKRIARKILEYSKTLRGVL